MSFDPSNPSFVIPAKAGIYHLPTKFKPSVMDPRLRGGDDVFEGEGGL
jgi:hypothetical protein